MAKVFIDVKQTFHKRIIMDIHPGETEAEITNRIANQIPALVKSNPEITFEYVNQMPTPSDIQTYECID